MGGAHADLPPAPAGHLLCPRLGAARAVQASPSPLQAVCPGCRVCGNNLDKFYLINVMLDCDINNLIGTCGSNNILVQMDLGRISVWLLNAWKENILDIYV